MRTFLFWNLYNKQLEHLVAKAAHERHIDTILLAECPNPREMLEALNTGVRHQYDYYPDPTKRVKTFSRLPYGYVGVLSDPVPMGYLSALRLRLSANNEILLAGVHLRSRIYMDAREQEALFRRLAKRLAWFEDSLGHQNTVVIGDLNSNPYDPGVISTEGLHAVQSRRIAARGSRLVAGERFTFFYNPMWSHFGDTGASPPGTYYYDNSSTSELFWYMLDQVLIRPTLLPLFRNDSLEIITSIGETSLLTKDGRPDARAASDHLPIMFALTQSEGINGNS